MSFFFALSFFLKLTIWLPEKQNQEYMINLDKYCTDDDYTYKEIYQLSS